MRSAGIATSANKSNKLRDREEGAKFEPDNVLTGIFRLFSIGLKYSNTWLSSVRLPGTERPRPVTRELLVISTRRD